MRDARRFIPLELTFANPVRKKIIHGFGRRDTFRLAVLRSSQVKRYYLVCRIWRTIANHKDSKTCTGTFGARVVSLPCAHSKAALVTKHDEQERTYQAGARNSTRRQVLGSPECRKPESPAIILLLNHNCRVEGLSFETLEGNDILLAGVPGQRHLTRLLQLPLSRRRVVRKVVTGRMKSVLSVERWN
ncbi:hypothetical protein FVE85_4698 [Porphyridium purpureum]|uniref:Uncharacterized protein n=1 Tax=Porphyridium purpureum TaxID=35688 RepID=A0A5J4YPZ0_PORPP|nr:hypothetical protein FVE85_4698 [Porphyridium purpureum]|eukprot:POR5146..scf236_6